MPLGLPLRTMKETSDVVTRPLLGVSAQLESTRPALTSRSMSGSSENDTTSALRPASTARLCSPEAPKDDLKPTPSPSPVFWNSGSISS